MQEDTVIVRGYTEFVRACDHADRETRKELRSTFREVGEVVRVEWAGDEQRFGAFTASGLRTIVRQRGVSVEQTRRKTTGLRPDFGRLQQSVGDQVFDGKEAEIEDAFEKAIDRVADHFERG